jgi:hypothetical protein
MANEMTPYRSPTVNDLLRKLQRVRVKWVSMFKKTLEVAREGGEYLTRLQREVGEGQWLLLVAELGISRSTSANWQRIYERWDELQARLAELPDVQRVAHLGVKKAIALLADPAKKKRKRRKTGELRKATLTLRAAFPARFPEDVLARLAVGESGLTWEIRLAVNEGERELGTLQDVTVVRWKLL